MTVVRAYRGDEPFVFVSYAHEDEAVVHADLAALEQRGVRVWYDAGLRLSEDLDKSITEKIRAASYLIAYVSPRSIKSKYVTSEVRLALVEEKQVLLVVTEETDLSNWQIFIHILAKPRLERHRLPYDTYLERLYEDLPAGVGEEPGSYPVDSAEADLAREIREELARAGSWTDGLEERMLKTAALMEMPEADARRVIDETRTRVKVQGSTADAETRFRHLVRHMLESGPITSGRRSTLANRADILELVPSRWEAVVQAEAVSRARALMRIGEFEAAGDILISSVGRSLPQLAAVRELMAELAAARSMTNRATGVETVTLASGVAPGTDSAAGSTSTADVERMVTQVAPGVSMTWIHIPGGLFRRGCPQEFIDHVEHDLGFEPEKHPLRSFPIRIEPLAGFWIGRTPVTNALFEVFVVAKRHRAPSGWSSDRRPSYGKGNEDRPVTGVTWSDAVAFADWLGARLPTRAQYEKACRGTEGLIYPWGNTFEPSRCNTAELSLEAVQSVYAFPEGASVWGVLDLVGNVWEWSADGESPLKMSVGASFEWPGELYGAGFLDLSRPPESSAKDLGLRLACEDPRHLPFPTEADRGN